MNEFYVDKLCTLLKMTKESSDAFDSKDRLLNDNSSHEGKMLIQCYHQMNELYHFQLHNYGLIMDGKSHRNSEIQQLLEHEIQV